jgi:hypothetical protein
MSAMDEWKMVPVEPTQEMCAAAVVFANGNAVYKNVAAEALKIEEAIYGEAYAAMLAAAPEPPHLSMTREEAQTFQNWAGMDGACAFHLIERHANGWGDVARMMDAWLQANSKAPNARLRRDQQPARTYE